MRKLKMTTALLLVLCMLLSAFTACTPSGDEGTTPSDTTEAPSQSGSNSVKLTEGGNALFTIVRPDIEVDDPNYKHAKTLAAELKEATGAEFKHETDFISWNTKRDPEKYEILLGYTNYDETSEILKGIKYYDYAIVIRGHKIILAAYTDANIKKAITYFCNNMIPLIAKDSAGDSVIAFEDYYYRSVYKVESLALAGKPIEDYTVVYGKDRPSGEKLAQNIVDVIASATGVYLPIADDSEPAKECEILAGKTNRAESAGSDTIENLHYKVSLKSGKLIIDCRGATSGDAAIRKLYAEKMAGGGKIDLPEGDLCSGDTLTEKEFPLTAGSDIRIITYNILKESWIQGTGYADTPERAELFGGFLDVYQPDVVGVQEVGERWVKFLPNHLGKYKLICTNRPDGGRNYSAIVYDASKYDVEAQGVQTYSKHASAECRNMAWAILVNKTTGVKFAFISTHWDFGSEPEKEEMRRVQADELTAKIASLKATYGCPVFITGDFNCTNTSESYSYFMKKNGMTNALTNSEYYYNAQGTTSIDFVMATTGDAVFKGYKKLQENGLATVSDHWANLADIDLK